MHILYVTIGSLEINTSTSIFNMAMVNGLVENDCHVDIITVEADLNHNNYDTTFINHEVSITRLKLEISRKLSGRWRKNKLINRIRTKVGRIVKGCKLYEDGAIFISYINDITITKKYDLVISSSDPKISHLFTEKLIECNNMSSIPWIQIWSDPFADDISRKMFIPKKRIETEEERLLGKAIHILYISKLLLNNRQSKYPTNASKMHFLPIPFLKRTISNKGIPESRLRLAYLGDYNSKTRNIMPLYKAVEGTDNFLTICGSTNMQLKNTTNIKIFPRLCYAEVMEIEKNADILIQLSNLSGYQIPGKAYQYSGTDKPILFILDGDKENIRKEFEVHNRYHFVDNNIDEIKHSLNHATEMWANCENKPLEAFSPNIVARTLLNILKE